MTPIALALEFIDYELAEMGQLPMENIEDDGEID